MSPFSVEILITGLVAFSRVTPAGICEVTTGSAAGTCAIAIGAVKMSAIRSACHIIESPVWKI
jgi:hypothetical protein